MPTLDEKSELVESIITSTFQERQEVLTRRASKNLSTEAEVKPEIDLIQPDLEKIYHKLQKINKQSKSPLTKLFRRLVDDITRQCKSFSSLWHINKIEDSLHTTRGYAIQMNPDIDPIFDQSFTPRTELAKKLWEIRQRAIRNGLKLKSSEEIRQELIEQRGFLDDNCEDLSR